MPRDSTVLAQQLDKKFITIDRTRKKVESLLSDNKLSVRDVNLMYESFYLKSFVEFENFLEYLFWGLIVEGKGVESSRNSVKPKIEFKSFQLAREVIIGPNKKYLDWMPYDRTKKLSKVIFEGGRPFTEIIGAEKGQLTKAQLIRNAIAHLSLIHI